MHGIGADAIGVDWRLPLDEANRRLGGKVPLQGNIDPALLSAPWHVLEAHVRDVVNGGAKRQPTSSTSGTVYRRKPTRTCSRASCSSCTALTDAVVIGGGIGGLVAARELALGGLTVTLLEASDRLGGTVARHTVGGIELDAGAESFATRGSTVRRLAADLGLGDEIVQPDPRGAWLQPADAAARPIPAVTLLGIPGHPLARDVSSLVGVPASLRAHLERFLPGRYAAWIGHARRARAQAHGRCHR